MHEYTWEDILYEVTHCMLVIEYFFLTIAASYVLSKMMKLQQVFHYKVLFLVLVIFAAVARADGFLLLVVVYTGDIILSNSYGYFISIVPAFVFFTAYCFILFQWVVMVFTIRAVSKSKGDPAVIRRRFMYGFLVFTFIQYSSLVVLATLSIESGIQPPARVPYAGNEYEEIMSLIISISYTFVSLFFIVCGILLIRQFNTNLMLHGESHAKTKWRMICIVILVPVTFLVRVVFVGIDTVVNLSEVWWLDWVYYTLFEWIPLSVLVLLSSQSANQIAKPPRPLVDY